jgi:hypothetical protein
MRNKLNKTKASIYIYIYIYIYVYNVTQTLTEGKISYTTCRIVRNNNMYDGNGLKVITV